MSTDPIAVDIIVPVFNEHLDVVRTTIADLKRALAGRPAVTIIVVDDGSDASCRLDALREEAGIVFVRHETNRGYGAALKTGIRSGRAPWIAITDADGTYPVESLSAMIAKMGGSDLVVGARVGDVQEIPLPRRFPKALLNGFASYMAGCPIADLNSGMRVFTRDLCDSVWGLLPAGFSFTSTITMGAVLGGYRLENHPINYYKRVGKSSIKPLRDTVRFFLIVARLGMLFAPLKVFGPVSAVLLAVGVVKGFVRDYLLLGRVGNVAVMLILTGIQVFMMGLLGEMIVNSRHVSARSGHREPA